METVQIRVSSKSDVAKVAGMMAACIKEGKRVEAQAIGAGAVNQTVKAIIVARGYVAPNGLNLSCIPAFASVNMEDDEQRSAIKFILVTGE